MAKAAEPLNISFFATGLYTHRSALFSPYRALGVNVITYHDAAIDGQDMEIGSSLQWSRRPGFARFCGVAFGASEYPLQFYSARQPSGMVECFVDTNENFSTFTSSSLTPLFPKSTTAQGFIQQVGGITYYADGTDLQKWTGGIVTAGQSIGAPAVSNWGIAAPVAGPTISGTFGGATNPVPGFWAPFATLVSDTLFVVDYNGNIEIAQNGGVTGPEEPVWSPSAPQPLQQSLGSTTDGTVKWNNLGSYSAAVWVASTVVGSGGSVNSGVLIDNNGNLQQCQVSGTTGTTTPTWNATLGGTTTDNTVTWVNRGPGALSVQSSYTYAYGYRTIYGHLSTLSPMLTIGAVMGPLSVPLTGASTSNVLCNQRLTITNIAIDGSNNLTVEFSGTPTYLAPGQGYTFSAVGVASFLNGQSVEVASVGTNSFTAVFTHAFYASTPDTGTASFNGVEIYRTADGGGILYYAVGIPNHFLGPPTNSYIPWTFTDTIPDSGLDSAFIGPIAHLNDPPPGTTGSLVAQGGTILAYWQGRIWMAVGNMLYFDAGPDCINGVPEESWPPANVFQYPGPITGLNPTSQGLLVWGADYLSMALGGPQTLSFFPYDLLKNFGVSSPNCISQDGDTLYALLTSGQCFMLNDSGKSETGNYIVNLLSAFPPQSSYVAMHRNGTDSGLWLGNGSSTLFRYSLNIQAWSTKYLPVGGVGAIRSVETSVGFYTLCAGRTSGGGYILGRSLSTWQDDSQNYTNCFVTIGSVILSPPGGTLVPVQHITGYFAAVGALGPAYLAEPPLVRTALKFGVSASMVPTAVFVENIAGISVGRPLTIDISPNQEVVIPSAVDPVAGTFTAIFTKTHNFGAAVDAPAGPISLQPIGGPTYPTISILPNEIADPTGTLFLTLGQPKSEYTTAQTNATSSILSLRYDVDSMNVSALVSQNMHHLQIKVSWPPENAPNAIKQLSVVFEKNP